jgi:hypothetical protein
MSRGLELTLSGLFTRFSKIFITTFPRSISRFSELPEDQIKQSITIYSSVIGDNCAAIYRLAAQNLNQYLNRYSVHANQSADEYKIIYYLGRAIERHLRANGHDLLAQVHMATMIGLLDFRIASKGIIKPKLTAAMGKLIRGNYFDEEMGQNGCYMIYKCVSTTPDDITEISNDN